MRVEWEDMAVREFGCIEIANYIPDSECTVIFVFGSAITSMMLLRCMESQRATKRLSNHEAEARVGVSDNLALGPRQRRGRLRLAKATLNVTPVPHPPKPSAAPTYLVAAAQNKSQSRWRKRLCRRSEGIPNYCECAIRVWRRDCR